jgi:hypothetical protein
LTEQLLANNEQARHQSEEKLKDLQRRNAKLEDALKEKDRQIDEMNSQS